MVGRKNFSSTWTPWLQRTHSYVAPWAERARYDNVWTMSLNGHGSNTAPRQCADYTAAVAQLREVKKKLSLLGMCSIVLSQAIFKFDSVRGNNVSEVKNLQQITLKQNRTPRAPGDPQRDLLDKVHHGIAGAIIIIIRLVLVRMASLALVAN